MCYLGLSEVDLSSDVLEGGNLGLEVVFLGFVISYFIIEEKAESEEGEGSERGC